MNSPELIPPNQDDIIALESIADDIISKIREDKNASRDIITDLVSSLEYQSTPELTETWIHRLAPADWKSLKYTQFEAGDTGLQLEAHALKKQIQDDCKTILDLTLRHPGFLEKIHHRLLLQTTNVGTLSAERQDRIIAKELSLRYEHWKSLLGLLSNYEELYQPFLAGGGHIGYEDIDENSIRMLFQNVELEDLDIPDLIIEPVLTKAYAYSDTNITISILLPGALVIVSKSILARFRNILGDTTIEAKIRDKFGYIPVYKKRSFGDKPPKQEKEAGKLAWNK